MTLGISNIDVVHWSAEFIQGCNQHKDKKTQAHVKKRLLVMNYSFKMLVTTCCCSPSPLESRAPLGENHFGNAQASGIELEELQPQRTLGDPAEGLLQFSSFSSLLKQVATFLLWSLHKSCLVVGQGQAEAEFIFQSQQWEDEEVIVFTQKSELCVYTYTYNGSWVLQIPLGNISAPWLLGLKSFHL